MKAVVGSPISSVSVDSALSAVVITGVVPAVEVGVGSSASDVADALWALGCPQLVRASTRMISAGNPKT